MIDAGYGGDLGSGNGSETKHSGPRSSSNEFGGSSDHHRNFCHLLALKTGFFLLGQTVEVEELRLNGRLIDDHTYFQEDCILSDLIQSRKWTKLNSKTVVALA